MADRHRLGLRIVAALWAGIAALPGHAASPVGLVPTDTAASCLTRPERSLEFPAALVDTESAAVFRVRMAFTSADEAPRTTFTFATSDGAFRAAVERYVAQYRLPCLKSGAAPVEMVQEFEFRPGDGRKAFWFPARSVDSAVAPCLETPDRWRGRFPGQQGVALVRLRFASPERPPDMEVLYDGGNRRLGESVRDHVRRYRMPCLAQGAEPVVATQLFRFEIQGESRSALRDVALAQFVHGLKDPEHVRFDFERMGCPFDTEIRLYQPYATNVVAEIGGSDPRRVEFLRWLQRADLRLTEDQRRQVVGDSMRIAVPCGILDLL